MTLHFTFWVSLYYHSYYPYYSTPVAHSALPLPCFYLWCLHSASVKRCGLRSAARKRGLQRVSFRDAANDAAVSVSSTSEHGKLASEFTHWRSIEVRELKLERLDSFGSRSSPASSLSTASQSPNTRLSSVSRDGLGQPTTILARGSVCRWRQSGLSIFPFP